MYLDIMDIKDIIDTLFLSTSWISWIPEVILVLRKVALVDHRVVIQESAHATLRSTRTTLMDTWIHT